MKNENENTNAAADQLPVESVPANVAALVESEGADLAWGQVDAVQLCEWIVYAIATDADLARAWRAIEYRYRLAWAARQAAGGEYSPGGAA